MDPHVHDNSLARIDQITDTSGFAHYAEVIDPLAGITSTGDFSLDQLHEANQIANKALKRAKNINDPKTFSELSEDEEVQTGEISPLPGIIDNLHPDDSVCGIMAAGYKYLPSPTSPKSSRPYSPSSFHSGTSCVDQDTSKTIHDFSFKWIETDEQLCDMVQTLVSFTRCLVPMKEWENHQIRVKYPTHAGENHFIEAEVGDPEMDLSILARTGTSFPSEKYKAEEVPFKAQEKGTKPKQPSMPPEEPNANITNRSVQFKTPAAEVMTPIVQIPASQVNEIDLMAQMRRGVRFNAKTSGRPPLILTSCNANFSEDKIKKACSKGVVSKPELLQLIITLLKKAGIKSKVGISYDLSKLILE